MKVLFNNNQWKKTYRAPMHKIPLLVEKWTNNDKIKILDYPLIKKEKLYEIHDKKYVDGIFNGTIKNGFGNQDPSFAEMELYQLSSFLEASKIALQEGIACSPTAGFHHACYDFSGVFCIFNGLILSAETLHKENLVKKVGILDLDFHYGDGTDDIIKRLNLSYINHWGFSQNWTPSAASFFVNLKKGLETMKDCDIILYQAGMDMFKDDPKGGLLTIEEIRQREKIVFQFAKDNNIPLVWCLAGGYTEINFLVDLHNITMEECLKIYFK